jgi:hypothetical protein
MAAAKPQPSTKPDDTSSLTYPYPNSAARLQRYSMNSQLFKGEHFDAFRIKINNEQYSKDYAKLRYLVLNFAGLLSKVSADMLFGDETSIKLPTLDKDNPYNKNNSDSMEPADNADATSDVFTLKTPKPNPNQEWLENLVFDNRLDVQLYESAITNSYKGDALFKLRVGPLHGNDAAVIIEQIMPDYYFPNIDRFNVSAEPEPVEISFTVEINGKTYLRKEIHEPGLIRNEAYLMEGTKIVMPVDLSVLGVDGLEPVEETGIDRMLIVHIPNWSDGTTHFGYDDYTDLLTLMYAINNRMTKIDNILDKHADPILAIPDGILDEDGNINRSQLGVFEKGEDGDKPEYIVWDAKLESSFEEIDRLLDSLYMFSETSPSVFGVQGAKQVARQESGRALKYRLMRTVSKIKRKQRYYNYGIKEIIYLAQMLAQAHGIPALDVQFSGKPEVPSIDWPEPIPQDSYEQAQEEELRLSSGNQSVKDSIKNIDGLDDEQAVQKIQEIMAEQKQLNPPVEVPVAAPVGKNGQPAQGGEPQPAVPGQAKMKAIQVPKNSKPADVSD